MEQMMA